MQELQRENIFLRAQFTEKTESLSKEKIELEKKLAASEAGIKRIQEIHKETIQKHTVELKKQEERVGFFFFGLSPNRCLLIYMGMQFFVVIFDYSNIHTSSFDTFHTLLYNREVLWKMMFLGVNKRKEQKIKH